MLYECIYLSTNILYNMRYKLQYITDDLAIIIHYLKL